MTSDQVSLAREQLYYLLTVVRKEAVPLVDAFDFSDRVLCSTLGRYDGDVYRALLDWAKKAPRNKHKVNFVTMLIYIYIIYTYHSCCGNGHGIKMLFPS